MKTESEQLWYTWSTRGFGGPGFQIRAASPGFLEGSNSVVPENGRIQALLAHARYVPPANTKDSGDIPPQHLPVSLAFIKVKQEFVLLHKCYCPPDDMNASSNFFSHMITDLPEVSSPAGPIAFTAREAIATWGSSFWKTKDELPETQIELLPVTFPSLQEPGTRVTIEHEKMRGGTLDRDDLKKLKREYLEFILRAFLMRQPGQRIYVAASPEQVAYLLWGLTHCLPRTLEGMRDLTFTTYERLEMERVSPFYGLKDEVDYPVITGTCWAGSTTSDLPAMYYQDQGVNGFALNCYSGRSTPLMPDGVLARFVLFAVDCLLDENNHTYRELTEILKQAEREQCQDLTHFMRVYISYQETLSQNDVQELINIIKHRLDNIVDEEKMLLADLERLRRPNVQSSILQWIARNRSWWENTCRQDLVSFFACLDKYAHYPLPSNIQHVIDTLYATMSELGMRVAEQVNQALSSDHTDYMYFWMDMLELTAPLHQSPHIWLALVQNMTAEDLGVPVFQRWWQIKGESIFQAIHQGLKLPVDENLVTPLTPFGKNVVDKILVAIQGEDRWSIDNWQEKLIKITSPRQDPAVWIYLFEHIVTRPFDPIYWEWWNAYGKHGAEELNRLGRQNSNVADRLYQLGELIISNIVQIITQEDPLKGMQSSPNWPTWSLWNEMFSTLIALADTEIGACRTWLDLWGNLWPYVFTPIYEQWWQHQGAETALTIRRCAEKHPQSEVAQNVADFIFESILPLTYDLVDLLLEQTEEAAQRSARNNLFIVLRVLLNALPAHHQEVVWLNADNNGGLLEYLTQTIQTSVDEIYPWEIHRTLLETWAQVAALGTHPALYAWLNVSWGTIGRLLADKQLPDSWHHMAIDSVLLKPVTLEAPQLKNLLQSDQSWQAFQHVLQHDIASAETAPLALTFFHHLVEIDDPHKGRVLGSLLLAARALPDVVQELLQLARLTSEETATFLEQDGHEMLQLQEWPAAFTTVLHNYVTGLDASRLSEPTVTGLLCQLQQRGASEESGISAEIALYVNGWLYIEKLLSEPEDSKRWVRLARSRLGQMLGLQPEARGALADVLWPILVRHLNSEMDLTRVLDNLGPVLTGTTLEAEAETETGTALLLNMATHMAAYHQQQPDIRRLVPYLKVALEQAQETLYPKNEAFLLTFFQTLCGDLSAEEYEQLNRQSELWPLDYKEVWQTYIQQQRNKNTARVLAAFKKAVQNEDVEVITQAYQQVLKEVAYPGTHVNQQERDIALLAGDIVSAYKLVDQGALFQAHQGVLQSPYKDRIRYTPEIEHAIANLPEVPQPKAKTTRPLLKHRNSQMLTKIATQPNAEILKALEQSVQETNARTTIGTVQSKSIMLDQLNKIHAFKRLYIGYRLSILDTQIKNSPWNSKERSYYKKEKKELQEVQRQNDQFLRRKALDDLIDNVFINSGIESRIKQGQCGIEEFLLEQRVLEQFRSFQPDDYVALVKMHNFTETDVKQVLRIFRRRERFAERLLKERYDLDSWLEERKKLYQDQIQIEVRW
ncbi:GAP1-N2 domain-containing protein [Dictyobacter aurantiacus]|uniref:GTPase-associated protein 1 N-terminal domain-containing protein n=1 Tax=Dictyobacter aurantiacus TaxID=1936993 RepID=A0A401ZCR7_9CHLR|nr:hypothetical protein [Dictyobacter aurantiacus]GCE04690.1 hypothetical protein KDAU_20190 [Dictyobacter aurantiacus]